MSSNNDELVTLEDVYLLYEKPMAKLFSYDPDPEDDEDKFWVPNSLVKHSDIGTTGEKGFISIPEWKAEELGLI